MTRPQAGDTVDDCRFSMFLRYPFARGLGLYFRTENSKSKIGLKISLSADCSPQNPLQVGISLMVETVGCGLGEHNIPVVY